MKLLKLLFLIFAVGCQSSPKATSEAELKARGIDREAIRQVIRANINEIRKCYEVELKKDENLKGKLLLSWEITKGGKAINVKASEKSEHKYMSIPACVGSIVQSATFPEPPTGADVTVIFPFYFDNK